MKKPGIEIDIPGFGKRVIHTVVSDFTGTLSFRGKLLRGVEDRLLRLKKLVRVEVVTADTRNSAEKELRGIVGPHRLTWKSGHDVEKLDFAKTFDLRHVAAFGNGNNDRLLLRAVRDAGGFAVAVVNAEGCALDAILAANIFISGAASALDLLIDPKALIATLRF